MSELIYVDRLKKDILDLPNCYNGFSDTYDKACIIGVIDEQPTIEERKKGRWIWKTSDIYRCSECNTDSHVAECMEEPIYNFCPYCGADMRGDGDD